MKTTDPRSSAEPRTPAVRRRRWLPVLTVAGAALLIAALAYHLYAQRAYDTAGAAGRTADRLAAAQLAAQLEPWNDRFAWRVVGLRGLTLFEQGKLRPAYFLLESYMPIVFGRDATFIAIYKMVRDAEMAFDSGQPHIAHGLDPYNRFNPISTPSATYTTGSQATSSSK
jgi:hypothetical protein